MTWKLALSKVLILGVYPKLLYAMYLSLSKIWWSLLLFHFLHLILLVLLFHKVGQLLSTLPTTQANRWRKEKCKCPAKVIGFTIFKLEGQNRELNRIAAWSDKNSLLLDSTALCQPPPKKKGLLNWMGLMLHGGFAYQNYTHTHNTHVLIFQGEVT